MQKYQEDWGNFREALNIWVKLSQNYPGDETAQDALLQAAQVAHKNLKNYKLAKSLYSDYLSKNKLTPEQSKAIKKILSKPGNT